jgi:hypothetical protein
VAAAAAAAAAGYPRSHGLPADGVRDGMQAMGGPVG